ncbi:hypothetical protein RQP46_010249 [Phenoliferia psychrophenolica]
MVDGGYEWCRSVHAEGLVSLLLAYPDNFPINAGPINTPNLRHLSVFVNIKVVSWSKSIFSPTHHYLESLTLERLDDECAPALIACLSAKPFPLVRHLVLEDATGYKFWPTLLPSFPSLLTLEILGPPYGNGTVEESVTAVGASVVATLQNLVFTYLTMEEAAMAELLRVIKLPHLAGLRRIEIPMVSKDKLAGEAGLALLDECEKRSISLLCRYGWLTRGLMKEDDEENVSSPQGN